ncbi:MAG: DNA cytosine methyltransferase [Thermomicrobiales bacterium]
MIRHLDTFAGIGGFSLAASWTGAIEPAGFVEIDPWCRRVLAKHWPGVPQHDDIKTVTPEVLTQMAFSGHSQEDWEAFDMAAHRKEYQGAVELYEAGASIGDCADYYGISRQAMWKILQRRGVEFRPQLRFGEENHFWRGGMTSEDYAHNYVEKAILRGEITPTPCEVCGDDPVATDGRRLVHAHHDDYNYPMRVRFLCQLCHHEWHKHNRAIARGKEGCQAVLAGTIDLVTGGY